MSQEWLYGIDEWIIFAVSVVVLCASALGGYAIGRRLDAYDSGEAPGFLGAIQGALLGLLGLLLSFTFAMTVGRFDVRRELVPAEANAIRAAYFRTSMVPEPERAELRRILVRYVDARLDFFRAGQEEAQVSAANAASDRLFDELWSKGAQLVERYPNAPMNESLVASFSDVSQLQEKRRTAMQSHVPEAVFFLLFGVSILSMVMTGYVCVSGKRHHLALVMAMGVMFAIVILVIMDLDRPRRGIVLVSQESMIRLRASIEPPHS